MFIVVNKPSINKLLGIYEFYSKRDTVSRRTSPKGGLQSNEDGATENSRVGLRI